MRGRLGRRNPPEKIFRLVQKLKIFYSCCCLPTPMTLASWGSPIFPLVVHQPASPSIGPDVQSRRRGLSIGGDNVVRMWVKLKRRWVFYM